jgi:hypothetical protein
MTRRILTADQIGRQTIDELRALTPEEKFRQLETLIAAAPRSARTSEDEADRLRVRELWMRLHVHYGTMPPPAAAWSAADLGTRRR